METWTDMLSFNSLMLQVSSRVGGRKEGRMDRLEENFGRRLSTNKNRDPGVNSDEEDEDMMFGERDDMFQFDRLSHCSSLRSELSLSRLGKYHHHHHYLITIIIITTITINIITAIIFIIIQV